MIVAEHNDQRLNAKSSDANKESVKQMLGNWSDAMRDMVSLPPEIAEEFSGKRIALVGFDEEESLKLAAIIEKANAFTRNLLFSQACESGAIRPFDMAIVKIDAQTDLLSCIGAYSAQDRFKPILVVGSPEAVISRMPEMKRHASDFLTTPWYPEEIILRAHRALADSVHRPQSAQERRAGDKARIVVADDNPTTTMIEAAILRKYDMECHIAQDGGQALDIVQSMNPDAVVLDINMPHLDGFEVLAAIKNDPRTNNTHVIMLTSRQNEADIMRGFGLGADDYIIKPFNPMELVARLKRLLRK